MTLQEQYLSKKLTPEEAVSLIEDHNSVFTSNSPISIFDALFVQRERFSDLHIQYAIPFVKTSPEQRPPSRR